ncbi:ModE family transcriptional regulator [Photobacterium aquae]|uniref:ModE family transcriptional regulator n=1 Tax=Photobacterium aquae TaxID=1195763 RepID=A0A0J1GWD8_9GAMM|nr:TOBE domain-containing protein [Photobacterium aquae]KLV04033.1 ModE family transcriptional regulator [Photobacterium aquae]
MEFDALLTLSQNGKMLANPKRIALLKSIATTGSISQGAKQVGISYKTAFDAIKEMNQLGDTQLVSCEKGGKGGGGASLTEQGKRLVQMYDLLEQIQEMGLNALKDDSVPLHSLLGVMSKLSLQTSARNQLFATIKNIENHALYDLITLQITAQCTIIATITHGSTLRLGLSPNKDAVALIKGPAITIRTLLDPVNKEENQIRGIIRRIERDSKMVEVCLEIGEGNELNALVTEEIATNEQLNVGMTAYACFPSSQVIVATLTEQKKTIN